MNSPVPMKSRQRASTSPRRSAPLRIASSTSSRPRAYAAAASSRSAAAVACWSASRLAGDEGGARRGRLSSAPVSVRRTRPRRAPGRRRPARRAMRGRARARRAGRVLPSSWASSTTSSAASSRPRSAYHRAQVLADLREGPGRDAVEHQPDPEPRARAAQELPRHGVGVARGGRDEQPRVGRGEQLPRERAVGLHDGVDVGRVEKRQAGRERLRGHELQRPGRGGRAAGAAHARAGCGRPRTSRGPTGDTRAPGRGWSGGARRRVTSAPTRLLTSVDLPAPVEPPTTISSGASICSSRGGGSPRPGRRARAAPRRRRRGPARRG